MLVKLNDIPDTLPASDRIVDLQTSVVTLHAGDGMGSGFVISEDGYIVSNQHVVGDAKYVRIKFSTGLELNGEVVARHRARDVALVKCGQNGLKPLTIRRQLPKAGEEVFAIGTPIDQSLSQTVTRGIVSGYRSIDGLNYLQSDVSINPGNSGGPLLDKNGNVIGVCVFKFRQADSLGFFVPVQEVLSTLEITGPTLASGR